MSVWAKSASIGSKNLDAEALPGQRDGPPTSTHAVRDGTRPTAANVSLARSESVAMVKPGRLVRRRLRHARNGADENEAWLGDQTAA